ncbi:endonuclease/exonuclease/phosphatase family protein [Weeksellaceae bacterium TAE3-ERU29]|nr:endonuclease/exonuclease/phosphatase family protein [Weeksellaceae bacterium TAE3-ERU29]
MKRLIFFINLIVILVGYSVYINQWVSPNVTTIFEYSALIFPVVIIFDVILILFWLIYRWKIALLFIFLSIGLVKPFNRIYHIYGAEKIKESNLKFMTYNLKVLSLKKENEIEKLVQKERPDILILQELPLNNKDFLKKNFNYTENYEAIEILSKFPIIESKQLKISDEKIRACYADIKFNNDTIRVINLHLSSTRVKKEQIIDIYDKKNLKNNIMQINHYLSTSFKAHQKQVKEIKRIIDTSPYPVIVGGDFNAVPSSYEYYKVRGDLKDTFVKGGSGLGTTFHDFKFPIRIDHVFASPEFGVHSTKVKRVDYSDHYPVLVEFNYTFKNK